MNGSFFSRFSRFLQTSRQWYETTPDRALEQAYDAALMIRSIENEHFDGRRISVSPKLSDNTNAYFQTELKKYLKIAEIRLSEFKTSRSFLNLLDGSANARSGQTALSDKEKSAIILEKLKFIDDTLDHYRARPKSSVSLVPVANPSNLSSARTVSPPPDQSQNRRIDGASASDLEGSDGEGIMDKTGVLPRSIVGTLNRIRRDLDPAAEQRVVQSYRSTRVKTLISIRFLILLIIIPLLTQQLSKILVIGPIVDAFRKPEQSVIFLNYELEEEALKELQVYRERLEFDFLLGKTPQVKAISTLAESNISGQRAIAPAQETSVTRPISMDQLAVLTKEEQEAYIQERVRERARELAQDYQRRGSNAIKNVFADIASVLALGLVLTTNRREVSVLKSFIDETVYGLSDSAKAFIIILFTDIFVGFHSPHGWEILLEGVSRHFGLPANRDFIFLFIATFPVILDTIFKYWIFRYLNRVSPSAVATYRNMNEQ